jgi:hypothetical protein
MQFAFEDTKPRFTTDDIVADLKRVASTLDTSVLSQRAYAAAGSFSTTAIKDRFGSWNAAIAAAGLDANTKNKRITTEELFDNLREVWIARGRQPRKGEMVGPISKFTRDPYTKRFGSWLNAVRAFVTDVNRDAKFEGTIKTQIEVQGRGPRDPSLRLRFLVMNRDNFKCRHCGRSPATDTSVILHIDHLTAWSKGGGTTLENLQTLCQDCNLGKSNLTETRTG